MDVRLDDGHGHVEELRVRTERRPLVFSFEMDVSGSMAGGKTDQAVAGLEDIVRGALRGDDLYGCSGFNSTVTRLHFPLPKRSVNGLRT